MVRTRVVRVSVVILAALVLFPVATAWAQSGIAGVVRDTTGAVLPGVTVEASSPVLIEKVRTVVTDDQGQYKIIDLRPGVYAVTFTLAGFSTLRREGIELTANFTAPVNAELRVGALAETVTVSGQSPVVDVQNVIQQRVMTNDVIDALPTARTFQTLAAAIPGIAVAGTIRPTGADVGGSAGEGSQRLVIHGSRTTDMQNMFDGMLMNNFSDPSISGAFLDIGSAQEISYQLGAISAETSTGGVHANVILKEGGNRFAGTVFAAYGNHNLQSDNFTDELQARGLRAVNRLDRVWDVNPSFGGPFKQDRLWFFSSFRYWGLQDRVAGMWYNKTPLAFVYTPDLSRQAIDDSDSEGITLRLTWQVTPKHKVNAFFYNVARCVCHFTSSGTPVSPEATLSRTNPVDYVAQVIWSAPVTNRLLLDAGTLVHRHLLKSDRQPDVAPDILPVTEQSTGLNYRNARSTSWTNHFVYNYKAALSYVTGSHALKIGFNLQHGRAPSFSGSSGDLVLQLLNGVPRSVTVLGTPSTSEPNLNAALGIYAQDQWTIKRLTLNAGLRYDYNNESNSEVHLPAVQFVGPRDFPAVENVPNWHDLSPRLGASYDLFGTGKTALKVSLSRYVAGETLQIARANNPVSTSVNNASRTWTDRNGNFFPECNMTQVAANGECGPLNPSTFGQRVITTRYDDDYLRGFGKRGYNWETSAGIQHELFQQVSVNASYFRRWYGNFVVTDNLAVSPADYDPYCVVAPVDARLPGGGGNQICGLYDINPAKFGQVNRLVTFAKNYGTQYENWNGVDLTLTARLPRGALLSGGVSTGRRVLDNCDVMGKVDNPARMDGISQTFELLTVASPSLLYCHQEPPFETQVKFLGTVGLPWDFQASATFQSLPGPPITATYVATSAQIRPSLGRNLSSGANGTANVELIQPGTLYDSRLYQVDARLSKIFKIGRVRIQGNVDLYNLLNASPVVAVNTRYGPRWLEPTYVLPGRLAKFGGQVNF